MQQFETPPTKETKEAKEAGSLIGLRLRSPPIWPQPQHQPPPHLFCHLSSNRGSRHTQSEDEGKSLDNVFAQEQEREQEQEKAIVSPDNGEIEVTARGSSKEHEVKEGIQWPLHGGGGGGGGGGGPPPPPPPPPPPTTTTTTTTTATTTTVAATATATAAATG